MDLRVTDSVMYDLRLPVITKSSRAATIPYFKFIPHRKDLSALMKEFKKCF